MDLATLFEQVKRRADTVTPALLADVLRSDLAIAAPCWKCTVALPRYVASRLRLHHLHQMNRDTCDVSPAAMNAARSEASQLRHSFYKLPCTCGQRREYTYS